MKLLPFLILSVICAFPGSSSGADAIPAVGTATRTVFVWGGTLPRPFLRYVVALTKKTQPRVCFVPTASGDNAVSIANWYEQCKDLPMRPYVQPAYFGSSLRGEEDFEANLMSMDAIVVGGGNTLNMLVIWKAHGIDRVLRRAYENGTVMAGASAGSLCWFAGGITDSRPGKLSVVECLGFIPTSHSPHYDSGTRRRSAYHEAIMDGALGPGYACDNGAAVLFENERFVRSMALNGNSHCYFVTPVEGVIQEQRLPSVIVEQEDTGGVGRRSPSSN